MNQMYETHEVLNLPPDFTANLYKSDTPLQSAVKAFGADWGYESLRDYGDYAVSTLTHPRSLWTTNQSGRF